MWIACVSVNATAISIHYIGPEKITEEVPVSPVDDKQLMEGVLFEKAEEKVIGSREVVKGVCANKKLFLVYKSQMQWVAEKPDKLEGAPGETGVELAMNVCKEVYEKKILPQIPVINSDAELIKAMRLTDTEVSGRKKFQYNGECTTFKETVLECIFKTVELIKRKK